MKNKRLARIHDYKNKGSVDMKKETPSIPQEILDKIALIRTARLKYKLTKNCFNIHKEELKEAMDKLGLKKVSHEEIGLLCVINKGKTTEKVNYAEVLSVLTLTYGVSKEVILKLIKDFTETRNTPPVLSIREKKTNIGPIITE